MLEGWDDVPSIVEFRSITVVRLTCNSCNCVSAILIPIIMYVDRASAVAGVKFEIPEVQPYL